jgi:predicted RNA-binding Zn ribbon-like protein
VPKQQDAPGRLELVRAFVNTLDVDLGTDALDSPATLGRWLAGHDLLPAGDAAADSVVPSAADFKRALELRAALRTILLANNGVAPSGDPYAALNAAGHRGRYALTFASDGTTALEPTVSGTDGALAQLVALVYDAARDGEWERLKICRDNTCEWSFYDYSKNRSAAWCSMEVCGNRNKVRLFRTRARGA